jgi:hypothetical protein
MSNSPMKHAQSAPDLGLSKIGSSSYGESLSPTSTFSKTIPLSNKTIHVIRNPAEAYKLKDVEWVIQGSEEHVRSPLFSLVDYSFDIFENQ